MLFLCLTLWYIPHLWWCWRVVIITSSSSSSLHARLCPIPSRCVSLWCICAALSWGKSKRNPLEFNPAEPRKVSVSEAIKVTALQQRTSHALTGWPQRYGRQAQKDSSNIIKCHKQLIEIEWWGHLVHPHSDHFTDLILKLKNYFIFTCKRSSAVLKKKFDQNLKITF